MKGHSFSKMILYVALSLTLIFTVGLIAGCKGSTGDSGVSAPTTGTVSGTVVTAVGATPLAGVVVTTNPVVSGATATTDSSGSYSLSLPQGSYTITFTLANYTTAVANAKVIVGSMLPTNVTMAEATSGKPSVVLSASGQDVGFGQSFTVTAQATSPVGGTLSYVWSGATGSGNTATATSVTLATALGGTSAPSNDPGGFVSPYNQEKRFGILPLNDDTRGQKTVSVTVNDGQGGTTSSSVTVFSAGVQGGVKSVALGVPVYMNSGVSSDTTSTWSVQYTGSGTSTATMIGSGRNAYFIPDLVGPYLVSATTPSGPRSMTVYAGTYAGAISGGGYTTKTITSTDPKWDGMWITVPTGVTSVTYTNWPTVTPDGGCMFCHNDGSVASGNAPDEFTPWSQTAHATFFARGIEGITSNNGTCVKCHTVGYDQASSANNGGFDDVSAATGFVYNKAVGAWASLWSNYPTVARVSNIQCENCHGPQNTGPAPSAHKSTSNGSVSDPTSPAALRVSFGAEVCAQCHSSGTGHHIYSEWNSLNPDTNKGHSNFNQFDATGYTGHAQSTNGSCARCHTAQGFTKYVDQLATGNAGTLPASVITWDKSNAQPQTCTACHDPHNVTNENQLRITGSIKNTMAGFGVDGVGKGALCMACHNNRNGVQCATAPTSTGFCPNGALSPTGATFLHEDSNTNGALAAAPDPSNPDSYLDSMHDASQTEVLMGRDFFFMGDSLPILSKHANVKDACVGCHMVLNPQTHLSHGTPAVSTHNFYIKDADVPTLCANCHGNGTVDGEALQTFVENQLAVLGTKMSTGFKNKINAATGAGLYYYISTNKTTTQIASATTVTYSDGSFYVTGNLTSGQTGTTLKVTLTSFTTDNNGTAGAGYFPLIQPNDNLKKGSWNWTMIERDGSKGIHNPTLIQQVLTNSIAATY